MRRGKESISLMLGKFSKKLVFQSLAKWQDGKMAYGTNDLPPRKACFQYGENSLS
jgi:hypothetical protein